MNWKLVIAVLALAFPAIARADSQWILESSTIAYHISHPLHQVDGVSHEARGKGVCHNGQCDFLIAAPIKSFDSGDSNRDLHMLQVTRGGQYPMVTVRTHLPESAASASMLAPDLEIQFAGQTAAYKRVAFQCRTDGKVKTIMGILPTTISDFKIDPPSLLAVPIKNAMPIRVDMTWQEQP